MGQLTVNISDSSAATCVLPDQRMQPWARVPAPVRALGPRTGADRPELGTRPVPAAPGPSRFEPALIDGRMARSMPTLGSQCLACAGDGVNPDCGAGRPLPVAD